MPIDLIVAICNIKGMENLTSYVADQRPASMGQIAQGLEVSRPYLYQLLDGTRSPSLEVARRIERLSNGRVPVASWDNFAEIIKAAS